jgi:hypothetical protein
MVYLKVLMYLTFLSMEASIGIKRHFKQNSSVSGPRFEPDLLTITEANITTSAIKSVKQVVGRSERRMDRQSDRQEDLALLFVYLYD